MCRACARVNRPARRPGGRRLKRRCSHRYWSGASRTMRSTSALMRVASASSVAGGEAFERGLDPDHVAAAIVAAAVEEGQHRGARQARELAGAGDGVGRHAEERREHGVAPAHVLVRRVPEPAAAAQEAHRGAQFLATVHRGGVAHAAAFHRPLEGRVRVRSVHRRAAACAWSAGARTSRTGGNGPRAGSRRARPRARPRSARCPRCANAPAPGRSGPHQARRNSKAPMPKERKKRRRRSLRAASIELGKTQFEIAASPRGAGCGRAGPRGDPRRRTAGARAAAATAPATTARRCRSSWAKCAGPAGAGLGPRVASGKRNRAGLSPHRVRQPRGCPFRDRARADRDARSAGSRSIAGRVARPVAPPRRPRGRRPPPRASTIDPWPSPASSTPSRCTCSRR